MGAAVTPENQTAVPVTAAAPAVTSSRLWLSALLPLVLLAGLVTLIVTTAPGDSLRGTGAPPVERLAIDRVQLRADGIELSVLNDGPDEVTIAQVTVDDAYWAFDADGGKVLKHLGRTRLRIPYPWVEGEAHLVKILTSALGSISNDTGTCSTSSTISIDGSAPA